jgi:hypothetical protein
MWQFVRWIRNKRNRCICRYKLGRRNVRRKPRNDIRRHERDEGRRWLMQPER